MGVNDAGMVRITWFDPENGGGSVIERYEVQIKDSTDTYVTPADDCRTGTSDIKESEDTATNRPIHLCRIDMSKMQDEFSLNYDDPIVARVRAVNAAGLEGEWQESDDSAKVKTKPEQMPDAPYRGASTDSNTLHVQWDAISSDQATGGSEIIYYSVYIADETDSVHQTSGTSYLYEQVGTETFQTFRVAASNIYGTGEKSDLSLEIEFGSVPAKLTGLRSENVSSDNERATIVWDGPDASDNVTGYTFEILNKDTNTYENADSIMEDDDNLTDDWGKEFDCNKLIENFGYQAGDTITFRVSASNDVGSSEWSYPTIANMGAYSLNMLIL